MRSARQSSVLLFALALSVLPALASAQPSTFRDALEQFAEQIRADVEADGVGSIAVAVIVGDSVVWAHAFGWADRDRGIRADARTIYRTGSISKSITAVALMRQVERGRLSLEDPVVRWLPGFSELDGDPARIRTITLGHLASHTGGLIREPELDGAAAGPIADWESKVMASIPRTSLRTAPGEAYAYSNVGYGILGLTVSRAVSVPFMSLVTDDVFRPLGMTSSYFVVPASEWSRVAIGYANNTRGEIDTGLPAREHEGRGYKVPNGGVYSTVGDLARFIALMSGALGDEVLRSGTRTAMLTSRNPDNSDNGYGLGFQVNTDENGDRFASHGGSVAGYTAGIMFHPESRIGVALLRNYNTGRTNLETALRDLLRRLVAAARAGAR
ncbi:MAG: beta-lactamase family protein [Gemmatimonadetes bacterium]|nr:beta-lactamase family protein [Gemmatimonadota bacterium]